MNSRRRILGPLHQGHSLQSGCSQSWRPRLSQSHQQSRSSRRVRRLPKRLRRGSRLRRLKTTMSHFDANRHTQHASRLHRRSSGRAACHRVVRGAWLGPGASTPKPPSDARPTVAASAVRAGQPSGTLSYDYDRPNVISNNYHSDYFVCNRRNGCGSCVIFLQQNACKACC